MHNAFLAHHGIKGQKWGIRRFQNPDGTLTAAGKLRRKDGYRINKFASTTKDVNDIFDSMSIKQKKLVSGEYYEEGEKWIPEEDHFGYLINLAHRYVQYYKDVPVSYIEVWDNGSDIGEVAIGTRTGYQGQGYATRGAKEVTKWFDKYGSKTLKELHWDAFSENTASIATAKKAGFVYADENDPSYTDARGVTRYVYRKK